MYIVAADLIVYCGSQTAPGEVVETGTCFLNKKNTLLLPAPNLTLVYTKLYLGMISERILSFCVVVHV